MAYVITDECVACGTCAEACPAEAISEGDGKYVIDADECLDRGTCEGECPPGGIVVGEKLKNFIKARELRKQLPCFSIFFLFKNPKPFFMALLLSCRCHHLPVMLKGANGFIQISVTFFLSFFLDLHQDLHFF